MIVNQSDAQLSKRALILLAKDLRDELERIPGVKRIDFAGEEFDQFQVALNPDLLERYGVSFQEVLTAINREGGFIPAGQIETDLGERSIRIDTRKKPIAPLSNTRVLPGTVYAVKDLSVLAWWSKGFQRSPSATPLTGAFRISISDMNMKFIGVSGSIYD